MQQRKIYANIAFALLVLIPLAAMAQPGSGHPGSGHPGAGHRGHGPGGPERVQFLIEALDLSEEQIEEARAIRESARAESETVRAEHRTVRAELRAAFEEENLDAAVIGGLVIELRAGKEQLRAIREDAESRFVALLDEEQSAKWELLRELREERRERRGRRPFGAGFGADRLGDVG